MTKRKNPHAVALGRAGGKKGGVARVPKGFSMMGKRRLSEIARKAARKRWQS